jgi:hypothetical protein
MAINKITSWVDLVEEEERVMASENRANIQEAKGPFEIEFMGWEASKSTFDDIFKQDHLYKYFTEYKSLSTEITSATVDILAEINSHEAEAETVMYEYESKTERILHGSRFKSYQKMLAGELLGVNVLVIDYDVKKIYFTRVCETDLTICLLVTNFAVTGSVQILFEGERGLMQTQEGGESNSSEVKDELLYVTRVVITPEAIAALLPGECIRLDNVTTPYNVYGLATITETIYNYNTGISMQYQVEREGRVRKFNRFGRNFNRWDMLSLKNKVYEPRPKPFGAEQMIDDELAGYARQNIEMYIRDHPSTRVTIPGAKCVREEVGGVRNSSRAYYYPMSHAGTSIINNQYGGEHEREYACLYGSAPKKIFSKYVQNTNGLITIMRTYSKAFREAEDSVDAVNPDEKVFCDTMVNYCAVIDNNGRVSHIIAVTSYTERISQTMLCNIVYEVTLDNSIYGFRIIDREGVNLDHDVGSDQISEAGYDTLRKGIIALEKRISTATIDILAREGIPNARTMIRHKELYIAFGRGDGLANKRVTLDVNRFREYPIASNIEWYDLRMLLDHGLPLYARDSLAVRLNRRSRSAVQEGCMTSVIANEVLASFVTGCKAVGPLEMLDARRLVKLPCGWVSAIDNPMLHRHSCTLGLHALTNANRNLKIHSAYKCSGCNNVYNNNILAHKCSTMHQ